MATHPDSPSATVILELCGVYKITLNVMSLLFENFKEFVLIMFVPFVPPHFHFVFCFVFLEDTVSQPISGLLALPVFLSLLPRRLLSLRYRDVL